MISKVPSNTKQSMIQWFFETPINWEGVDYLLSNVLKGFLGPDVLEAGSISIPDFLCDLEWGIQGQMYFLCFIHSFH